MLATVPIATDGTYSTLQCRCYYACRRGCVRVGVCVSVSVCACICVCVFVCVTSRSVKSNQVLTTVQTGGTCNLLTFQGKQSEVGNLASTNCIVVQSPPSSSTARWLIRADKWVDQPPWLARTNSAQ